MKVRLQVKKENEIKYKEMLEKGGFEISDNADLVLEETGGKIEYLIAKDNQNKTVLVYLEEIVLIETYGKEILLHTKEQGYSLKGTIESLSFQLSVYGFKRISQSSIIHKRSIIKISPVLSMKFMLTLKNKMKVDVTRSYYYDFKEYIGL